MTSLSPNLALRVLVAEDSEFNAQLMEKLLVRRGHTVVLAADGKEALDLAKHGNIDLLLLDVHMPKMDGFEVIGAIRAGEQTTGAHLPVIAVTARSRAQDRERCLAAGMDDFLSKPILVDALWATIERVMATISPPPPQDRSGPAVLSAKILLASCGEDEPLLRAICDGLRAALVDELELLGRDLLDRVARGISVESLRRELSSSNVSTAARARP